MFSKLDIWCIKLVKWERCEHIFSFHSYLCFCRVKITSIYHNAFSVMFSKSIICDAAVYRTWISVRFLLSNFCEFHCKIRFSRLSSSEIARGSRLRHEWKLVPLLVFGSSNFNLAPKSMRSPPPRRPDRTGTLIYLVSDRFITPARVRAHPHE